MSTAARLQLTRAQILAFRRTVGALDRRLTSGTAGLRRAAWVGLQDSMPRAALLSLHARVEGVQPESWEDPTLVQIWGPRFSAYVIAAEDRAIFTLSRLSDDPASRQFVQDIADRLEDFLAGRRLPYAEAAHSLGLDPNALRYAAPTGRVLLRWEGARRPTIWTVPAPEMDPHEARLELARRYLHCLGPTTAASFAQWAGLPLSSAEATFTALRPALLPIATPLGDAWLLAADEPSVHRAVTPVAPARLLPSGDAYWLLQGRDRELLVPDHNDLPQLWTSRVWPGAVLIHGEIAGIWRRSAARVTITLWRQVSAAERAAVEAEAQALPLPALQGRIRVLWAAADLGR